MLLARAYLAHFESIEGSDLVRRASLLALLGVEAALAIEVRATADDVEVTGEEERMRSATADVNDVFVKHIKRIDACRDART